MTAASIKFANQASTYRGASAVDKVLVGLREFVSRIAPRDQRAGGEPACPQQIGNIRQVGPLVEAQGMPRIVAFRQHSDGFDGQLLVVEIAAFQRVVGDRLLPPAWKAQRCDNAPVGRENQAEVPVAPRTRSPDHHVGSARVWSSPRLVTRQASGCAVRRGQFARLGMVGNRGHARTCHGRHRHRGEAQGPQPDDRHVAPGPYPARD